MSNVRDIFTEEVAKTRTYRHGDTEVIVETVAIKNSVGEEVGMFRRITSYRLTAVDDCRGHAFG